MDVMSELSVTAVEERLCTEHAEQGTRCAELAYSRPALACMPEEPAVFQAALRLLVWDRQARQILDAGCKRVTRGGRPLPHGFETTTGPARWAAPVPKYAR